MPRQLLKELLGALLEDAVEADDELGVVGHAHRREDHTDLPRVTREGSDLGSVEAEERGVPEEWGRHIPY